MGARPQESSLERAKRLALERLNRRALSRAELVEWLASRGCSRGDAEATADEMARLGAIDDAALTGAIARRSEWSGPRARRALDAAAERRRIDRDQSARALDEHFNGRRESLDAAAYAERALAAMPPDLPTEAKARRIFTRLLARGYEESTAEEVVRTLFPGLGD